MVFAELVRDPLFRRALGSALLLFALSTAPLAGEMWEGLFREQLESAEAGETDAQYEVGIMYLKGQGVAANRETALRWLTAASGSGHTMATAKLSRMKEQEGKLEQLAREADAGDTQAQYELAMMYLKGRGIAADESKAQYWLRKAAERNDAKAVTRLGILAYKGEGGAPDYQKALSLFNRVSGESVLAQYYLGEMYAEGAGVRQDYTVAIDWYRQAAAGGFNRARGKIINCEEELRIERQRGSIAARTDASARSDAQPVVATTAGVGSAATVQPSAPTAAGPEPVAVKVAPQPRLSALDVLASKRWRRGERPVDYLPSAVTNCDRYSDELICFSDVLTRESGTRAVRYRVKSTVKPQREALVISYRNLVLDVADSREIEDQPLGYDDQVEQGFHIQTGWTQEHIVSCERAGDRSLRCVKDETHSMTLVEDTRQLTAGNID